MAAGRPGVVRATVKLVGTSEDSLMAEAGRLLDDPATYAAMARAHNPYGDGKTAGRIVARLLADHRAKAGRDGLATAA